MTEITSNEASPTQAEVLSWVERIADFLTGNYGLPPITGRIVGWLMICEPAEQSAAQIASAISASRASLTTNLRFLALSGLLRRVTRAGDRTAYYRIDDNAWEEVIRRRLESLAAIGQITRDGLSMVGADSARGARIRATQAVFDWAGAIFSGSSGPSASKRPG